MKNNYINKRLYNLIIGLVILYGIGAVLIAYQFIDYYKNIPILILGIGYLILIFIGIKISFDYYNSILGQFIGYNFICIPMGMLLSILINIYDINILLETSIITIIITISMIILSLIFDQFFLKIGNILFNSLVVIIIINIIFTILHINTDIISWISSFVFALYIGHDFKKSQNDEFTIQNAIRHGSDFYLDLVNLFINILDILDDN